VKPSMTPLKDFAGLTDYFFAAPEIELRNEKEKTAAEELVKELKTVEKWEKDEIFAAFKSVMEKCGIRMPVLYYICTGREKGLPLPESVEILGKDEILLRLEKFV